MLRFLNWPQITTCLGAFSCTAWTQGLQLLEGGVLAMDKPQQSQVQPLPAPCNLTLHLKTFQEKKGWEPERDTQTSKRWAHQNMAPNKETQRGRELGKKDVRGTNKI